MENRENSNAAVKIDAGSYPRSSKPKAVKNTGRSGRKLGKAEKQRKPLPLWLSILMLMLTWMLTGVCLVTFLMSFGQTKFQIAGASVTLFMSYAAFGLYVFLRKREIVSSFKQMLFICVCLLAEVLPLFITMKIDIGFMPFMLAVLLMGLMSNERIAILALLPAAAAAGVISGAIAAPDSAPEALIFAVMISGLAAVLSLNIGKTRSSTVIAAGIGGIVGVVCFTGVMFGGGELFNHYWSSLLWLLGTCLVSGVLTVGLMPVFEAAFDIASEARLNELLNNNNPLIKRLMTEAPGTYHHSLIVATLAEAAAEEIGANALLCRVCACYHDVGKLRAPLYFKENQHGRNIHDELDPYESARAITAHVTDGVTLLEKHKLPGDVVRIVSEHHGDSVVVFFYDKAKKLAPEGTEVDESLFRYHANKPSSKESALLMLADCCEAAVRSMNNPTMKDIETRIRDVITHKWDKRDSMLWNSPLTFVEIKKIEKSFLNTFAALYHERIEYPDLEEIDVR